MKRVASGWRDRFQPERRGRDTLSMLIGSVLSGELLRRTCWIQAQISQKEEPSAALSSNKFPSLVTDFTIGLLSRSTDFGIS